MSKGKPTKQKIISALNEAVAAIGNMPAEDVTEQQQEAYRMCMEVRDKLNR